VKDGNKGYFRRIWKYNPHLVVKYAAKAIDYYKKVFEVEELYQTTVLEDKSKIVHVVITIRTSKVMIVDEFSQMCDDM
jgi:uncharacterized glyoxalase superfamily protein PhnB